MPYAFSSRLLLTTSTLTSYAFLASAQSRRDTVTLPPIVVTATRVPVRADEVSATLTVLSGDALRAAGIATVADALRAVPGAAIVATGSFGGQTSLFLRGGESDYVKVLVDGVPQNQPGGFFDFANLSTEDVDRIEIVRGPVSVLYGSDAVAGVIQVFTRNGRGRPHGRLALGGGTYGTEAGTGELTGRAGALSYAASLARRTTDGIYADNNRYQRDLASLNLRLVPDARTDATLFVRHAGGVFHFPTDFIGKDSSDFDQYTTARALSAGLEAGRWITSRLEARLSLSVHRERNRFDDGPDSLTDTSAFCCFHSDDVVRRVLAGAQASLHLSTGATLAGGLELERQRQGGTTLDTARRNRAVYLEGLTSIGRGVSLVVGGRLDDNQEFGTHATGRAGVAWRLAPRTRIRASAGSAFKEPSFFENFATGFARGNPALRPERSTSWEVGFDRTLGLLTFVATYYAQRFRDFIQYSPTPVGPDSVNYTNIGAATARGTELSVSAGTAHGFTVDASYSYLDSRDAATGERLQRRPTHAGSLRLRYATSRADGSLGARYTGDRTDLDFASFPAAAVTLPPHTTVDASASVRITGASGLAPGLVLTVRIEDLLDARFEEVLHFRAPGRTLFVQGVLEMGR